jgi:hypothetical protein
VCPGPVVARVWGSRTRPLLLTWPLRGSLVFVDEATEDGPTLDSRLGKVRDRVIGPGRAELAAAVRAPPVVMGLVVGQDRPEMPLAEDEPPAGELSQVRDRIGPRYLSPDIPESILALAGPGWAKLPIARCRPAVLRWPPRTQLNWPGAAVPWSPCPVPKLAHRR